MGTVVVTDLLAVSQTSARLHVRTPLHGLALRAGDAEPYHRPVTDLEAAWNEIHDAKPDSWFVGPPVYIEHRDRDQYAFDTRERAKAGHRSREWTAVGQSELEVVREMARCLREICRRRDPDVITPRLPFVAPMRL